MIAPPTSAPTDGTPRVLFACGGTGGHVYPAIAIADAVRAARPGAAVAFAGTRDRMEWAAVPKAGYPIHAVTVSGFQRGASLAALRRNATFPLKLAAGLRDAWRLVGSFDADVVVGTGGYVSGPVGAAAVLRRRPLVIQEQNAIAGATNKLLASRAAAVFVGFEATLRDLPRGVVAGNPVRADLVAASASAETRQAARAEMGIPAEARVLLVTGGSLGAAPLNAAVQRHVGTLLANPEAVVVWAVGTRYFEAIRAAVPVHERLHLVPYLDRMDLAYASADLAVARSGALTCSELAATGTPSVLVPSPERHGRSPDAERRRARRRGRRRPAARAAPHGQTSRPTVTDAPPGRRPPRGDARRLRGRRPPRTRPDDIADTVLSLVSR